MIKIEELREVKNIEDIEGLEIKAYIPIKTKEAMINGIVNNVVKETENGMYTYDSALLEVMKAVGAFALYTNVELLKDDYENYDIVMNNRLLSQLECYLQGLEDSTLNIFSDVDDFYNLLDSKIEDKMRENTIEHAVAKGVQDVVKIIDGTMEHVNGMLDKGDPNKIAKYLSKGIEVLASKVPDFSKFDVEQLIMKKGEK